MQPLKIVVKEGDDMRSIKESIGKIDPEKILLESDEVNHNFQIIINQKTNYIAQKLMEDNWRIDKVKYYKGKLFKVILSRKSRDVTPRRSFVGEGYE